jgi:hypothetical protein
MNETLFQNRSLEDADAVIIALRSKRFVIVRQDDTGRLYPEPLCKRIRDLRPGDTVHYQGKRDTVCGLCAY